MSRRDLIRMSRDEIDAFLAGRNTMNIATLRPDGSVHLVAMWYGFLGNGNVVFETFAKSQKVLNLRRDPRITTLVETGEAYEELKGVEMVGRAIIHDDRPTMIEAATSVASRYFPIEQPDDLDRAVEMLVHKRVAVEVVPEKIVSWDHSKLAGVF